MSISLKKTPRFLPTLTEVVHPSSLDITTAAAAAPDYEEVVRSVMQRVDAELERRVLEEAESLVRLQLAQQWPSLRAGVHQEIDSIVRRAVTDALACAPGQPD